MTTVVNAKPTLDERRSWPCRIVGDILHCREEQRRIAVATGRAPSCGAIGKNADKLCLRRTGEAPVSQLR
jgi:4'-phosphopantetheinyl transferase EntD